jgi:hypothetical protein
MAPSLVPAMKSTAKQGNVITDRVHTYGNIIVCLARQAGPGLQRLVAGSTEKAATDFAAFATILVPSANNVVRGRTFMTRRPSLPVSYDGSKGSFPGKQSRVKTQTTIKLCEPRSISPTSVH